MTKSTSKERRGDRGLRRTLGQVGRGARNALDIIREGRLSAPRYTPFEVIDSDDIAQLRRYAPVEAGKPVHGPVLFVPPLMVYSEVYDISPELSAVLYLVDRGVDVWLIDFGAPEHQTGGMKRTLDDHVLAIDRAIDVVRERTGALIHLIGYSQGGIFCYEIAAYRQSRDLASIVTFGAPVDIYRNLPLKVHDELAERVIHTAGRAVLRPLEDFPGWPALVTGGSFRLLYPANELKHLARFIGLLPDREALEMDEPKRRFLGGGGFTAWPGPAFRDFVAQVVAENRLLSGGLVINKRTVSLSDITCPILYFHGLTDNLARSSSVKAIERVAPRADACGVAIDSGHFGMVVGSRAMSEVWPAVIDWIRWRTEDGELPQRFAEGRTCSQPKTSTSNGLHQQRTVSALYRATTDLADNLWQRLGDASLQATGVLDALRWQLPRLARIESLTSESRVSPGRALADQAAAIPGEPFLLWRGRVYTYDEGNRRTDALLGALIEAGSEPWHHVGVMLPNGPDLLTTTTAISRLGAVSVVIPPAARDERAKGWLNHALDAGQVDLLITDPAGAELLRTLRPPARDRIAPERILITRSKDRGTGRPTLDELASHWTDSRPSGFTPNSGRADDLAMILFTRGTTDRPKGVRITNRRWALAALATAAGCRLTPRDTVYGCLPLHHALGLLVGLGGALVGGARFALAPRFEPETFWDDVRRMGATVVPYHGEMCRALVSMPQLPKESKHPVRLFVGSGLDAPTWSQLTSRFGDVDVLELYASTEGNVLLANLTGDKVGSVGRPVVPTEGLALVRYDDSGKPTRNDKGRLVAVGSDEPGLLVARIDRSTPLAHFDGYANPSATEASIVRDAFATGDAWFVTGDILRCDSTGDFWFLRRASS